MTEKLNTPHRETVAETIIPQSTIGAMCGIAAGLTISAINHTAGQPIGPEVPIEGISAVGGLAIGTALGVKKVLNRGKEAVEKTYTQTAQKGAIIGGSLGLGALVTNEALNLSNYQGDILTVLVPGAVGATVAVTLRKAREVISAIDAVASWKM